MKKISQKFRDIKKLPNWFYIPFALALKFSKKFLMRTSISDPYKCLDMKNVPCITVTWHNRLLYFPAIFPKKYRYHTYALISPSRDGQYVSDLVNIEEIGEFLELNFLICFSSKIKKGVS